MKKRIYTVLVLALFSLCLFSFVGCGKSYDPYMGKWVSAQGDELLLNATGTFQMKVSGVELAGTYKVYFNTMYMNCETTSSEMFFEWDVRGSTLYLISLDTSNTLEFFYQDKPAE